MPPATTEQSTRPLRELSHRECNGVEVTLLWRPALDEVVVCVCDHRRGSYFQIRPEPQLALEVFYHPYSYVGQSDVLYEDNRLAA